MTETNEQAKEAAAEVGKKIGGFLGNLAEKAKNIDVKDLAEKAKSKVGEVQARANELTAGKTSAFASPREEVTAEQMKEIIQKIGTAMTDAFPVAMEAVLADALLGKEPDLKMRSADENAPVGLALTEKNVFFLSKVAEQYAVTICPIGKIVEIVLVPPRGDVAGRLMFTTENREIKFPVASLELYCQAILFYKKFMEFSVK